MEDRHHLHSTKIFSWSLMCTRRSLVNQYSLRAWIVADPCGWKARGSLKPSTLSLIRSTASGHITHLCWFVSMFHQEYKIHCFSLQRLKGLVHHLTDNECTEVYKQQQQKALFMKHTCPTCFMGHLPRACKGFREPLELCSTLSYSLLNKIHYFNKHLLAVCYTRLYTGDCPPAAALCLKYFFKCLNSGDSGSI